MACPIWASTCRLVAMSRAAVAGALVLCLGVVLVAPGLAADPTAAPPGAVYGGRTTQAHPMSIGVTRTGKGLRAFFTRVDVGPCTDSRTFNIAFDFPKSLDTPVARGGRFTIATPINGAAATG